MEQHTHQPADLPNLSDADFDALFLDFLNPAVPDLELCDTAGLDLNQLHQVIASDRFQHALERTAALADARRTHHTRAIHANALARLADITTIPIRTTSDADCVRKATTTVPWRVACA